MILTTYILRLALSRALVVLLQPYRVRRRKMVLLCYSQFAAFDAMPTLTRSQIKFYAQRDDLRDALKRAASDDQRSASVLIERILIDWLVRSRLCSRSRRRNRSGRRASERTRARP